jgi:hypothetical protein
MNALERQAQHVRVIAGLGQALQAQLKLFGRAVHQQILARVAVRC